VTIPNTDHTVRTMLPAWELMDQVRASGHDGSHVVDVVAPLAGLLVLRWAAFHEAEQEAVAAFDDQAFTPFLPVGLRQSAWVDGTVAQHLLGELSTFPTRHETRHAKYVASVAPLLQHSAARQRDVLAHLIDWVARVDFESSQGRDDAAAAFDELLGAAIEKQGRLGGEHTTPAQVAELMVDLVDPRPGDRVYDPCFGMGGLLVRSARRMRRAVATEDPRRWEDVRAHGIFGIEINQASYVIGLCRVLMTGIDQPGLEFGDALERPLPRNRAVEGFDCILASPPWGGKALETLARQYPVPTSNVDNLFLQHVMTNLRPGGRAVIALPEGTLFRTGPDRHVRKMLLEEFRVDGVISLPAGAFAPCTSIPSSLVVFRRDTPRSDVRFVQISPKAWKAVASEAIEDGGERSGMGGVVLAGVTKVIRHESDVLSDDVAAGGMWSVPVKTLAARDFELLAKRTGAEALDITLERIAAASPDLKLASLDQVAKVFQGVSYDRKVTTERRDQEATIPLVRVADIAEPNVRPPALFFTPGAETRVHSDLRLQPGDILITTSGTVGKIGIVEDGRDLVGAVAAKSLAVIRSIDGMTPAFLAALLRSPSYREWFTGHARGATIQHLSVRTVRRLKVPVPPIPMQGAVLRSLAIGGDALALLLRLASGGSGDPIAAWLERPNIVAALAEKDAPADPAKALAVVSSELQHLRPLRNRAAHGQAHDIQPGLLNWLLASMEVGAVLDGIDAVPEGAPRLAALELAKTRLLAASRGLKEEGSPLAQRLQNFVSSVDRLVDRAAQPMLGPVEIQLRAAPNEVPFGVPIEVQLQLENASSIALRRLDVRTTPDVGSGAIGYLAEGASATIPLTVQALDAADTFKVAVRWTGVRLDGGQVRGERTIELLVKSTRDEVLAGDLGPSPYIVGNPVDREEMFFGRYDVLDRIQRQLGSATNANVILLEGNRRTGKTSILRQLQKPEALPGWIAVYCSFQDAEGDESRAGISTRNVYRLMARTIGWSLFDAGVRTWFPGEPAAESKRPFKVEFRQALDRAFNNEHPFEVFEEYLTSALAAVRPRRVLLMLDEFDKLQEGIDAGVTSPQVPENIRHILQHHQALSAILTGSRRLKRLREEYWSALFGLGYRLGISALPLDDARKLVTEPVSERLRYLPTARDRVVELCAAQPFLIQSICNRIFERAAESGDRTITAEAVEQAAGETVRDNEHFRTLWDYAHTHRRRFLLALCERLAGEPDAVTLALLVTKLEEHGVRVSRDSAVGNDLDYLRELELVEFDKSYRGGTYRIAVPLLGLWIRASIDFDDAVARAREEAEEAQA
jgi:type I restriction enzyme M protein